MTRTPPRPDTALRPPSGRRWATVALCLVIFVSGAVVGVGVSTILRMEDWPGERKSVEDRAQGLSEKIADRLDLPADQRGPVEQAVLKRIYGVEQVRQDMQPRIKVQALKLYRDVREALPDDKHDAWDKLFRQMYRRWVGEKLTGPIPPPESVSAPADTSRQTP